MFLALMPKDLFQIFHGNLIAEVADALGDAP